MGTYTFNDGASIVITAQKRTCSTNADAVQLAGVIPPQPQNVAIEGDTLLLDNSVADYDLRVSYSDNSNMFVEPLWSVDCPSVAEISASGLLTVYDIAQDETCVLSALYEENGLTFNEELGISIHDQDLLVPNYLKISGPSTVVGNTTAAYSAEVYYTSGMSMEAQPLWSIDCQQLAVISPDGDLTVFDVQQDESCTITAIYEENGFTAVIDELNVTLQKATVEPVEVIIDNGDSETSSIGKWRTASESDYYGTPSEYSQNSDGEYRYATSLIGMQDISLWWTQSSKRCGNVPVEIYDGDTLIDTVIVNQQVNGGQWNILDTYLFNEGASVVIVAQKQRCSTNADAVKFNEMN
ncbi:golvesin C-terminal-like domain-containing protein [Desulfogranum marinum]|uniref:golvesin C-terminal-like domain-containing protein n=1 Tax=Desulfogranum marinum TaxID=453220 RepID=UPI00196460BC|nr:hypothetical protein [Desulfogranum marinum]MBM9511921.1 hypothetical protein [Desulfogranum marinum]